MPSLTSKSCSAKKGLHNLFTAHANARCLRTTACHAPRWNRRRLDRLRPAEILSTRTQHVAVGAPGCARCGPAAVAGCCGAGWGGLGLRARRTGWAATSSRTARSPTTPRWERAERVLRKGAAICRATAWAPGGNAGSDRITRATDELAPGQRGAKQSAACNCHRMRTLSPC